MTLRRTSTCLVAAASLAALAAAGCSGGMSSPFESSSGIDRTFIGAAQTWDFDKNGTVSCDEWKSYAATSVREQDGNGDGALDASEFGRLATTDRLFETANLAYYDANGDGKVTADEMTGKQNVAFKLLDRNGDCQIDRTESVQVLQRDKVKSTSPAPDVSKGGPAGGM